jgi:hypothetical protein
VAGEELVAGEAGLHLGIDLAFLAQNMTAHIEFEHGVADPGVFAEAQGEVVSGHLCTGRRSQPRRNAFAVGRANS